MEIEDALERAHQWLKLQPWWSDDEDVITSVRRRDQTWVIGHMPRQYADSCDENEMIGGYGPVVIADDGGIIPAESCINTDIPDSERFAIALQLAVDGAPEEDRDRLQAIFEARGLIRRPKSETPGGAP